VVIGLERSLRMGCEMCVTGHKVTVQVIFALDFVYTDIKHTTHEPHLKANL